MLSLTAYHVALLTLNDQVTCANPAAQKSIQSDLIDLLPTGAALGAIANPPLMKMPSKNDHEELKEHHEAIKKARKDKLTWELSYAANIMATGDPDLEKMISRNQRETCRYQSSADSKAVRPPCRKLMSCSQQSRYALRRSLGPVRSFSGFRKDENTGMLLKWPRFQCLGDESSESCTANVYAEIGEPGRMARLKASEYGKHAASSDT